MQKTNHALHIGCHLSSAGGYLAMGKAATRLDADVFAFFTRNPRGGRAKPLDLDDVRAFCSYREEHGIGTLVAHAPYTMNACAAKEDLRAFAREAMADDLARLEHIPNTLYNFHPGSHVQQGAEKGIELIADLLNDVLDPAQKTIVLLETMAGKGTEVGRTTLSGDLRKIEIGKTQTFSGQLPADPDGQNTILVRVVNPLESGQPLRFSSAGQDQTLPGYLTLGRTPTK